MIIFAKTEMDISNSFNRNMQELRIKEIIKQRGMTIGDLAEKLGVSRQALSRQIQGKLLVETAERIAMALDVPIWQLFVSEEDVLSESERQQKHTTSDFCAFMKMGEKVCYVSSLEEARNILSDWEK